MKTLGNILIICGITLMIYVLAFMDISVEVNYPEGYSSEMPTRVNNLGLMADRQNYLIVASVFIVVGLILRYLPTSKAEVEVEKENKKCPQCAEQVKRDAKICRFCNYKFTEKENSISTEYLQNNEVKESQEEEITSPLNNQILVNLHNLIKSEQKRFFGGYSKKVATELENVCKTKKDTLNLIRSFKEKYNTDLLDEIRKISNHINFIEKNLKLFIDFEIVENEYPFKRKRNIE